MRFFILLVLCASLIPFIVLITNGTTTAPPLTTVPTTTFPLFTTAPPPLPNTTLWARTGVSGPTYSESQYYGTVTGSDGSVYAVGYIYVETTSENYDFGNNVTVSGILYAHCLIVKYDSNGFAQWAKTTLSGNGCAFYKVSIDSNDNIYVCGEIQARGQQQTFDFGNGVTVTGSSTVSLNTLLVKYNSSGIPQWARTENAQTDSYSGFSDVSVGLDGNIYVVGVIKQTGTYDFGNSVTLTSDGGFGFDKPILVKYNSSGVAQWGRTTLSGSTRSLFNGISAKSDIYITGYSFNAGISNFGNGINFTSAANTNCILLKYDFFGNAQWVKSTTPNTLSSRYNDLFVALDGSIYVVGSMINTLQNYNFGNNVNFTTTFNNNNMIVKYNSFGDAQLVKSSAGLNIEYYGVFVSIDGSIYVVGFMDSQATYDFDNNVIIPASITGSGSNHLIVKYNSSFVAQWAKTSISSANFERVFYDVSISSDSNVYAVGKIRGAFTFDFGDNVNVTSSNIYEKVIIVKYSS